MSTTINVTVGGNGLLDQSRQQMQANRFGYQERQLDQRTQKQAEQAKALQTTTDSRAPKVQRIDPEPAANRRGGLDFLLIPSEPYDTLGLPLRVKAGAKTGFPIKQQLGSFPDAEIVTLPQATYYSSGGPGNASYLESVEDIAYGNAWISKTSNVEIYNYNYDQYGTGKVYILGEERDPDPVLGNNWVVTYDAGTGTRQIQQVFSPSPTQRLRDWTFECYFRLGTSTEPTWTTDSTAYYGEVYTPFGGMFVMGSKFFLPGNVVSTYYYTQTEVYRSDSNDIIYGFFLPPGAEFDPEEDERYLGSSMGKAGTWLHVALCRQGDLVRHFVGGQLLHATDLATDPIPDPGILKAYFGMKSHKTDSQFIKTGIHGLRFTSKALYTKTFTPPASITSFG